MKARTRITVALAISLILAGSLALAVVSAAFRVSEYPTWDSYRDELLAEMDVSREGVIAALEDDPALFFDAPANDPEFGNGMSIDHASATVHQRAMDRAAARSLRWAAGAFVVVAVASLVAAWLLAGRILRPLRLVTSRAQAASGDDLSGRVALEGPPDEVKELADTFDAMLDRIEASFETQRRFSAQVAHELRTPLAVTRSEVDMLRDDVTDVELRSRLDRVGDATQRAERLVTRLYVLSRTRRGDLRREDFAFDELVGNVVGRVVESAEWRRVHIDLALAPVRVVGDRSLLESLVRNLVDNAGRHNRPGGWVRVAARPSVDGDGAELEVANSVAAPAGGPADAAGAGGPTPDPPVTDPPVTDPPATDPPATDPPAMELPATANVGLTIVRAVVDAHDGTIAWRAASPDGSGNGSSNGADAGSVTVLVRLPARSGAVPAARIEPAMTARPARPGGSA